MTHDLDETAPNLTQNFSVENVEQIIDGAIQKFNVNPANALQEIYGVVKSTDSEICKKFINKFSNFIYDDILGRHTGKYAARIARGHLGCSLAEAQIGDRFKVDFPKMMKTALSEQRDNATAFITDKVGELFLELANHPDKSVGDELATTFWYIAFACSAEMAEKIFLTLKQDADYERQEHLGHCHFVRGAFRRPFEELETLTMEDVFPDEAGVQPNLP
jgi:hypothetical protein